MSPSCADKNFEDISEFYRWWNDEENGLVKSRIIHDYRISVKYLPAEYLAYKELNGYEREMDLGKTIIKYNYSRSFIMTIEPVNERRNRDLLFQDIYSMEQFKERLYKLSFDPGEYIKLSTGEGKYEPVLNAMENLYDISSKKSLYLVFADKKDIMEDDLVIEFNDLMFETGINKFKFRKRDLDNIPEFSFTF
jgi:hypothetical protein